jgi:pheromone shutdown-related protein TraB
VIKEGKAVFLLSQLIMASFYKRLGDKLGVRPGAEMFEGLRLAEERNTELVLADRDVQITLKRSWGKLNLWAKFKLLFQIVGGLFVLPEVDENTLNELKHQDQLEVVLQTFAKFSPSIKETLIDERDLYLSQKIRQAKGKRIVAVVGAGHVPGIMREIKHETPIQDLHEIPKPSLLPMIFKWGIPLLIVGIIVYGFFHSGARHSLESISIWILVNGILAAVGAALALGHPLTVLSAFVAAPITSLNPTIAAGWVSGLVQAWVKKPTVADLEELPEAISSVRGFWTNPVSRILLVVVFSNLGSTLGTFISGGWIATRSL